MRVRNVEHITQLCPWAGIVQKCNALCATVYPAVHFLVPDFYSAKKNKTFDADLVMRVENGRAQYSLEFPKTPAKK
jgi:hypothetical protein